MNPDVIASQADTLRIWADEWAREDTEGASEVAFLLMRTARAMRGDTSTPEPFGHPKVAALEAGLPEPEVVSEIRRD